MKRLNSLFLFSRIPGWATLAKNYLRLLFIWSPLVSLIFVAGFGGFHDFFPRFLVSYSISAICSVFCVTGSYLFEIFYDSYRRRKKLPIVARGPLRGMAVSYFFVIPAMYVGFKAAAQINLLLGREDFTPDLSDYSSGIIFSFLISSFFLLSEVLRDSKEARQAAELKMRELENEKLKAQNAALSAQLNPHLLFNALNTIASTISTNPESAEEMIVQLSELYRGILKSAKDDVHSLQNELSLCRSYLEIENRRFGDRVRYFFQIEDGLNPENYRLPVLMLQPLVENAVKHGLTPLKEGGKITVKVSQDPEHLKIQVRDNGVGPGKSKAAGTGTGLSNCKARVLLRYGENSDFSFGRESDETTVTLRFPLKQVLI